MHAQLMRPYRMHHLSDYQCCAFYYFSQKTEDQGPRRRPDGRQRGGREGEGRKEEVLSVSTLPNFWHCYNSFLSPSMRYINEHTDCNIKAPSLLTWFLVLCSPNNIPSIVWSCQPICTMALHFQTNLNLFRSFQDLFAPRVLPASIAIFSPASSRPSYCLT